MENFVPVNFDGEFQQGKAFRRASIPYAYSGMAKEGAKVTLLRLAYSAGVETEKGSIMVAPYENGNFKPIKIITEVSLETGAMTAEYFHPVSLQWLYLLAIQDHQLLFFDLETGDKLYRVPRSELQSVKTIIF